MGSIYTSQHTLGTAAVVITRMHNEAIHVLLHNSAKSSNNKIYLGLASVTTGNGYHFDADEHLALDLPAETQLFAVSDPAGIVVEVMEVRP
jgi:hypothetical protein